MALEVKKNKYFYAISLSFGMTIVAIFLLLVMVKPLYVGNKELSKEVKQKKEKLEALENKLGKLKELKKEEEKLVKQKEKVLAALPKDKDVSRLFVEFEKMVTTTGATVVSAKSNDNESSTTAGSQATAQTIPGITLHNYEVKGTTSTYESIKNIIANSEGALRLVDINGFTFSKKDNSFDLSFNLKSFSRTEEKK